MSKVLRLINGAMRSVTIDGEVSLSSGVTNSVVSFPASLQTANSTPKVTAFLVNTTDSNPQFQPVTVTARSSSGFTATWNVPTDSANYKLAYIVPDGFVV